MAVLGTLILIFIVTHMANFWYKMKVAKTIPLHVKELKVPGNPMMGGTEQKMDLYLTTSGNYVPADQVEIKNHTELFVKGVDLKMGEGYADLYTVVITFFSKENSLGLMYLILYVVSMGVLGFHLWHGFGSAFQSLGLSNRNVRGAIATIGKTFAVVVSLAFAIIPIILYTR
jgi:succinate dehydrogenase / fumarate reductase cytochrome b subunit